MTKLAPHQTYTPDASSLSMGYIKQGLLAIGIVAVLVAAITLLRTFHSFALDDPLFLDSTLGELAVWMTDQASEEAPESILGQVAQQRLGPVDDSEFVETALLRDMKNLLVGYTGFVILALVIGGVSLLAKWRWHRVALVVALLGLDGLVFLIPTSAQDQSVTLILIGISVLSLVLLLSREHVERVVGFIVILSLFLVIWEVGKSAASQVDYNITAPVDRWEYATYDDLDSALSGVASGSIDVLLVDRRDVNDILFPYPEEDDTELESSDYPDLRYIQDFSHTDSKFGFAIEPELPGRVSLVTKETLAPEILSVKNFSDLNLGAVTGSFAETDYLITDRELILVELKILNDLNLPHLQSISEALLQPARRNGPLLLIRILTNAALYTWTEAILGFFIGATLGFVLGSLFAHVQLLQRSLLPYVVASQTIPIIALAPMIVIWLRDTNPLIPVAVISAYLTFFPVTINTLRGLQSPPQTAIDLMKSYAATKWEIMWKLRFPSALPYIFTALKVSATASVVGAIIGELPSGIRNGLGRAILDFSSDYSLISTPKLWSAILIASSVGILFFLIVTVIEFIVLRGQQEPQ